MSAAATDPARKNLVGLDSAELAAEMAAFGAERGRARVARFMEGLDARLSESPYVAGGAFTIADITAYLSVDFAKRVKIAIPEGCQALKRWHEGVSQRPSARV